MLASGALCLAVALTAVALAQQHVSFTTQDGGIVYADLYGDAERGVVLAHGGRFDKESWEKQARALEAAGFRALAIDFRGRGQSRGGTRLRPGDERFRFDVLAPSDTCIGMVQRPSRSLEQVSVALPLRRRQLNPNQAKSID